MIIWTSQNISSAFFVYTITLSPIRISFIYYFLTAGSKILPVETYSGAAYPKVPITLVVTCVSEPSGPIFASPKSESFAVKSYQSVDN